MLYHFYLSIVRDIIPMVFQKLGRLKSTWLAISVNILKEKKCYPIYKNKSELWNIIVL